MLGEHKTEGETGEPRVVILTLAMVELTERQGPLFLNEDGRPWIRNAVRCRFRRKLIMGGDLAAYLYRHAVCFAGKPERAIMAPAPCNGPFDVRGMRS